MFESKLRDTWESTNSDLVLARLVRALADRPEMWSLRETGKYNFNSQMSAEQWRQAAVLAATILEGKEDAVTESLRVVIPGVYETEAVDPQRIVFPGGNYES